VTSVSRFSAGVAVRSTTKSTFDTEICHLCIRGHGPHLQRQDEKAFNIWRVIEPCARILLLPFLVGRFPLVEPEVFVCSKVDISVTLGCDVSPGWSLLADLRGICVDFEIAVQEHSNLSIFYMENSSNLL
jgi:hypothetical protein